MMDTVRSYRKFKQRQSRHRQVSYSYVKA